MSILSICDNGDILSIMRIVKIAITIIKIVVPIILIISLLLNYLDAVKSNDADMLSKANKAAIPKIIAAILVFMIPTFVHILANFTGTDSYIHCLDIASKQSIVEAYSTTARTYIDKVLETFNINDYNAALSQINKVKDSSTKEKLINELTNLKPYVDLFQEINEISKKYDADKYNEILNKINNISNETIKSKLLKLLDSSNASNGKPLNIESSFNKYTGSGKINEYSLYIPKNATTNMPLIVFMPAVNNRQYLVNLFNNSKLSPVSAFMYIPNIDYSGSWQNDLKNGINEIVNKYSINERKISVTGFSTGGWYMYNFVANNQDLFSAILSVSTGHTINSTVIQNNLEYFKKIPMKGFGEENSGEYLSNGKHCSGWTTGWNAASAMRSLFNGLQRSNDFTSAGNNVCHSEISEYTFYMDNNNDGKSDNLEWMISQSR